LQTKKKRDEEQSGIWAEIQPYNYTGRGFYAAQIKDYLKYFPVENLLFIKSELLSKQTDIELRKIYKFLGLSFFDFNFERAPEHTSVNVIDPELQIKLRQYFGDRFDKVIEATRKEEGIESFASNATDKEKIVLLSSNLTSNKQPMPSSARSYLNNLFSEEIGELKYLVDFNLSDWQ